MLNSTSRVVGQAKRFSTEVAAGVKRATDVVKQLAIEGLRIGRGERHHDASSEKGSSLKVAARTASRQRERELILEALERTKWNRKRAARELQISYKALLYKLKQIGAPETGTPK